MMNNLARLSSRLRASLQLSTPELLGRVPLLRTLGSQPASSHEDSKPFQWAALVSLTGTQMPWPPQLGNGLGKTQL